MELQRSYLCTIAVSVFLCLMPASFLTGFSAHDHITRWGWFGYWPGREQSSVWESEEPRQEAMPLQRRIPCYLGRWARRYNFPSSRWYNLLAGSAFHKGRRFIVVNLQCHPSGFRWICLALLYPFLSGILDPTVENSIFTRTMYITDPHVFIYHELCWANRGGIIFLN